MKKRDFLKSSLGLAGLSLIEPAQALNRLSSTGPFELPKLPYSYSALEPLLDARTMEIHHTRHHQGYVDNLNEELKKGKFEYGSLEDLLAKYSASNRTIRNMGGGHFNHSLFWRCLAKPDSVKMPENLQMDIIVEWQTVDEFMLTLREAALSVKGSGWAWFCKGEGGRLFVTSSANQDNPLMKIEGIVNGTPLLGIDVWEHAYYLKYFDNRGDYFDAVWKLINWDEVERLRKAQ